MTDDSSTKISEIDWLRCYSHLVRTFMIAKNGCYPSTASMLMLLGRNNPQAAHMSGLAEIKKSITNALACEIEDKPHNSRDSDALAGKMRSGTTILITDLLYRLKTSSGMTHDAGAGITDMGWEIAFFKIFESTKERPIDKFIDTLGKVGTYLDNDVNDDGNVTIHIWLSMQFLHDSRPPYQVFLERDFNKSFVDAIVKLDGKTTRPILVTISTDSNFNEIDSITSSVAMEIADMLRSKGIMVTTDQRIWRSMYSVYGRQFSIFSSRRSAAGSNYGKTAIWAVMEKHLFRQRVFLMCATNRERVSTLNEGAYKLESSGIEPTVLKNATGATTTFALAGGEMVEEDYAHIDSTIFQSKQQGAPTTRFNKDKRFKPQWVDSSLFSPYEIEPQDSKVCYWFPVTQDDTDFLCEACRNAKDMEELQLSNRSPEICINCSANCQDHYMRAAPTLSARKSVLMLAARAKIAFQQCGTNLLDIQAGFQRWLVFAAASMVANHQLSYGENLLKSFSHMGGVRVQRHHAKEIFKNGRGKQFSIYREQVYDPATNKQFLAFRVTKDCGNVAYKDFFEKVAVPDAADRNEIFAHTRASAEKTGDIIEFWLGILDVANMAKGTIDVFERVEPADFLTGLEKAIRSFGHTSRTTSTINDKRKGSFDCTLQHQEAAVLNMLNDIPDYQSLPHFTCLNASEEAKVIIAYQKMMGVGDESTDAVMGDAETDADLGPPAQSADDEAEVISDDEDAAEYSARSGRDQLLDALGNLYELSETLTVCIYCGSTEHDHLQCENPNNKEIKKVLKNMREVLTEKVDVEMEQEEETTEQKDDAPEEVPKEQRQQQEQSRMGEYHWYEHAITMPDVGDLDEGGAFCIEGRKIDLEGPKGRKELMNIVDEAVRQGGGDTWKVKDFMDNYPDTNIRKEMYKRVSAPENGFLKVIPITGCMFHNYPLFEGVEYDINYTFPNNNRLVGYEEEVSRRLNTVLRHHVGKRIGYSNGLHCDDAGWVAIDELLRYETIWQQWSRRNHVYLAPKGRAHDKRSWNKEEAKNRLSLLFKIMFNSARWGRRVREQILAFGVYPDVDRNSEICRNNNIDANTNIPEGGLILYPVAVRAPSGHMDAVSEEVFLKGALLSHPVTPQTAVALPSCFHMTYLDNLKGIWLKGLIPGGEGAATRMFTFFNPYAPWDERSWKITKSVDTRYGGYVALYIPTETLMNELGGRITDSGQIITEQTIPFSKIRGGWVQDHQHRWLRLIIPTGGEQEVRSSQHSKKIASKEAVLRLVEQCLDDIDGAFDEEAQEVMIILNKFKNHEIVSGSREQYEARVKLMDYIIQKKPVLEPGCRHCPSCIKETPSIFSVCLHCSAILESHGIKPFRTDFAKEEINEDEDESTKADIDELKRKMDKDLFKDCVDQANVSDTQSHYDFDMSEVDYDDDDQEMDVPDEGEEEDEVEMDEEVSEAYNKAKEENQSIPKWAKNLETDSKKMPTKGLINIDMSEAAAHIFDNALANMILGMFQRYHRQRVLISPKEYMDEMRSNKHGRMDLDGLVKYMGEDDDGNLLLPTDEELEALFKERGATAKWSGDVLLVGGRPIEMMRPVFLIYEELQKIMDFLINAGYTHERLNYLKPLSRVQNEEERKAMRELLSSFVQRALKGVYPNMTHYTYFQSNITDVGHVKVIPAVELYFAQKPGKRNEELLLSAQQCGIILPPILANKVDYTLTSAVAEAERGVFQRIRNLAPNMTQTERQQALDNIGDTQGARAGREDAARANVSRSDTRRARAGTGQAQPKAPGPTSASTPSAKSGPSQPKSYGPTPTSAPPTASSGPSSSSSAPAGSQQTIAPKPRPKQGASREGPPTTDDSSTKRTKTG